jgi:hypothetical protein
MRFRNLSRAGVAFAAAAALAATLSAVDLPNLSGKWRLNRDASDSADAALKDAQAQGSSSRGGFGGRGGGGGMGHGGGGHRHSAPPDDSQSGSDDGSSLRETLARAQTLEIRHEEPRLSISDAIGKERVVYTDGRKTEEERSAGGTTKVHARWKDGRIEVTSVPDKGPKITETFSVTADRTQLMVTLSFERRHGGEVTLHRIYDAVRKDAPPPPEPSPPPRPTDSSDASSPTVPTP